MLFQEKPEVCRNSPPATAYSLPGTALRKLTLGPLFPTAGSPELSTVHLVPPLDVAKTPPEYSVPTQALFAFSGSTVTASSKLLASPLFTGFQVPPAFVLTKAPLPSVAA